MFNRPSYFPLLFFLLPLLSIGQTKPGSLDSIFPVRGLCISAPMAKSVDSFVSFINEELAPSDINTLILRVDWNYAYKTHSELQDKSTLSETDVKKIVAICRKNGIRVIPQINLLGHQSWAGTLNNLLKIYPEFDETPHVKIPEKYEWPNADGLYCKSYCPLHPDVHNVVFELVDEICDVFEADAFHAGMDEVFYLGEDQCPRCQGHDKAALFAGEVRKIRDHLAKNKRELWIWGDRLLEGKTSGLGLWEASYNNTHRAIDMIPKDVFICDWHYERPEKTAVLFATKGLRVATSPWRDPLVTSQQVKDMANFRGDANRQMKDKYQGIVQTVWSSAESFMKEAKEAKEGKLSDSLSQWASFETMVKNMKEIAVRNSSINGSY